jgi:hypothetical protein
MEIASLVVSLWAIMTDDHLTLIKSLKCEGRFGTNVGTDFLDMFALYHHPYGHTITFTFDGHALTCRIQHA